MGYKSGLADYYPAKIGIRDSEVLSKLVHSFFRDRPKIERILVPWDLSVVLTSMSKVPFEPLEKSDIRHLTLKTGYSAWDYILLD